jgi:hypothetical protein
MKGRSKTCYCLAAAGKEDNVLLLRQILRGKLNIDHGADDSFYDSFFHGRLHEFQ